MKISDMTRAGTIRDKFRDLQKMLRCVENYPRFEGYLVIDRYRIELPPEEVDKLLIAHGQKLHSEAAAIGLELDE